MLRAFIHVCNPPQPQVVVPPEIFSMSSSAAASAEDMEIEALYRPRALTVAAKFEYTGGLQFWRVPESGVYRITAAGAKAADGACRCAAFPPLTWAVVLFVASSWRICRAGSA